jgi:hypothetical protein
MISRKKKMSKILRKNSNGVNKRFNSRMKNKSKKNKTSIIMRKKSIMKSIFKKKRSIMKGGAGKKYISFIGSTGNKFTIEFPPENIKFEESKNSFFQFKYSPPDSPSSKPMYFTVNPIKLSVDILQFYINKAKQNGRSILVGNYLQLNENTITLELLSSLQYRSGNSESFIDIYESLEIDKEIYKGERLNNMYQENLVKMCNRDHFQIYVKQTEKDMYAIVQEDISWLKAIMMDLHKLSGSGSDGKRNIELFLEKSKTEEGKTDYKPRIFSCVDLDVDHSKIIIDNENLVVDGEEYVIVGYPRNTMRSYLDLYNKNKENKEIFDSIYGVHKSKFMEYMAGLHNFIPENKLKIILENLNDEIHNFYGYELNYKYTENFYKNAFEECIPSEELTKEKVFKSIYGIDYDPEFQSKFKALQKAFYNELASKCLNKPMMQIQYVFLIFKKLSIDFPNTTLKKGDYVPAVFNFRELTHKHHPILQRLEIVIKSVLPNRYGITEAESEEYKLWYSHYNYGDVFHIKTEYVHTMSNIQQQAYKYKNSITLEELIYMLSTEGIKLQNLKVEYQKKDIRFCFLNGKINRQHYNKPLLSGYDIEDIDIYFKDKYKDYLKNSVSDSSFDSLTKSSRSFIKKVEEVKTVKTVEPFLDPSNLYNATILLMFVETGNNYTFVYESLGSFYILKLKPNLTKTKIAILNYLVSKGIFQTNTQKIQNIDISGIDLYEVVEHRPIKQNDYKNIMRYNPLLVRTIKKKSNEPTISISDFFDSPLITISKLPNNNMIIPNPYNQKPLLIRNILATQKYVYGKKIFINNENKKIINNNTENKTILNEDYMFKYFISGLLDNQLLIHRIFFNPNNCSYNLIELKEETKSVIWIIPINNDTSNNDSINLEYYIRNFCDLKSENIKVLEEINKIYFNNNNICFINTTSIQPQQSCLHIHVYNNEIYLSKFANFEQGSRLKTMLNTKTAINLLKYNVNYFSNYEVQVLIHDK